jgi:hypothetical protein
MKTISPMPDIASAQAAPSRALAVIPPTTRTRSIPPPPRPTTVMKPGVPAGAISTALFGIGLIGWLALLGMLVMAIVPKAVP